MPNEQQNVSASQTLNSFNQCKKVALAMKKQLENLREALAKPEEIKLDDVEVSVRLEYIDDIKRSFEEAQVVIEQHLDDDDITQRLNFSSTYLDVKATLTQQMRMFAAKPSSTLRQFSFNENALPHSSARNTRLPEIQIPVFSGNYIDWPNFSPPLLMRMPTLLTWRSFIIFVQV